MLKTLYPKFQHWSEGGGVYIISDPHFEDDDCQIMNSEWPTPQEYVDKINAKVKTCDTLVCLGDVGNPEWFNKLKSGYKVLITGNHDKGASTYEPYFDEVYNGPLFISDKILLSHEPIDIPFAYNIHGHCHTYPQDKWNMLNVVADCANFDAINLKDIIKKGRLKEIKNIHRMAIDYQTENSLLDN